MSAGQAEISEKGSIETKTPAVYEESRDMDEYEVKTMGTLRTRFSGKDRAISDTYALQFVRGYRSEKNPEEVTVERFSEMLGARKKYGIDKILDERPEFWEEFNSVRKLGVLGHTREGRPVFYERLGMLEPQEANKLGFDNFFAGHIRMQEEMRVLKESMSTKIGQRMYKHIVVLDMNGFGMKHMSPDVVSKLRKFMSFDNYMYPESLKHLFIVNAPWIFRTAWALVKGMLSEATQDRIKIIGTDQKELLTKLTEHVDISQIPTWLGGKNEDDIRGICSPDFEEIWKRWRSEATAEVTEDSKSASSLDEPSSCPETATDEGEPVD